MILVASVHKHTAELEEGQEILQPWWLLISMALLASDKELYLTAELASHPHRGSHLHRHALNAFQMESALSF